MNIIEGLKQRKKWYTEDILNKLSEVLFKLSERPRIALASYPRSGNTWIRFMLEKSTFPLRTGAIYPTDQRPAEGIVIKTHLHDVTEYSKVIHVVRYPIYAIESFYYWKKNIGKVKDLNWQNHLTEEVMRWRQHYEKWSSVDYPRLFVRYEDLVDDPYFWLTKMLEFIDYSTSERTIEKAVSKNKFKRLNAKDSTFFRKKALHINDLEIMSENDINYVKQELGDLLDSIYGKEHENRLS